MKKEEKIVAYLLLVHKCSDELKHLIKELSSKKSHIFIHVDKKVDIMKFNELFGREDITFVKNRISITWKGFSMVRAEMELYKTALNYGTFKHFVLLSAECLNTQPISQIETFFEQQTTNFISCKEFKKNTSYLEYFKNNEFWLKISKYHFYDSLGYNWAPHNKFFRVWKYRIFILFNVVIVNLFLRKKKIPKNIKYYFGSQWLVLNLESCKYVVEKFNEKYLFDVFEYSDSPDEMYIHTIIMNSKFKENTIQENLHYIDWSSNREMPAILDERDYQSIKKSKNLFMRKISLKRSKKLINLITRE